MTAESGVASREAGFPSPPIRGQQAAPDTRVSGIPDFVAVWHEAWPLLERGLHDETEAEVLSQLALREAQLWGAWIDGRLVAAMLTQVLPGMVAVGSIGGSRRKEWMPQLWALLQAWSRRRGAQGIVIFGRRGWQRLLGFRDAGKLADGRAIMVFPLEGAWAA